MSFPNLPDKYHHPPLFTATDVLKQRQLSGTAPAFPCPQTVIFCYHGALLRHAVRTQRGRKVSGFYGDTYLLRKMDGRIAVSGNFGVGAPVTTVMVEDFVAYGVRRFVAVGLAGGLQAGQQAGDIVVADRAIRDEGTSYHYAPPAGTVQPPGGLTAAICHTFTAARIPYDVGTSWTTDAPYRETAREVSHYQAEGVKTVEMEAAALFTVGAYLGVEVAALFVIGDTFTNSHWVMAPDGERVFNGLRGAFDTVVRGLYQ